MKIMFAGDIHGSKSWWNVVVGWAAYKGCDAILQVGDLNYFPNRPHKMEFIKYAAERSRDAGVPGYFIDGNHENHEVLKAKAESQKNRTDEGFCVIEEGLYYIPRGTIWNWNGVSFMGFGGAFSIDLEARQAGVDWFPQETIETSDVYRALDKLDDHGPVDILITHEAPSGLRWDRPFIEMYDKICQGQRESVRNVVEAAKPKHLFHGHYHTTYDHILSLDSGHQVEVHGLGREGDLKSMYVQEYHTDAAP